MHLSGITWVMVIAAAVWAMLLARTFQIQLVDGEKYRQIASNRAQDRTIRVAPRGRILDRNGNVLAQSIQERNKDEANKWDTRRVYPQGVLASQLLGRVGRDGQGLFGLEYQFDEEFRGTDGWQIRVLSGNRVVQAGRKMEGADPIPGKDLVLTIDKNIQEIAENALKAGVEKYRAQSASAIIADPATGEILAMANYPSFDPNVPLTAKSPAKQNDCISKLYEPGSTFKAITAATAIETKSVNPKTVFSGEKGRWAFGSGSKDVIHDDGGRDHGDHDMTGAMAVSSNIIFAKIADSIGDEKFFSYIRKFGFRTKTSIELPGEEVMPLKELGEWSGRTGKTVGFGHEIMVNPMQMVMSYCAIANGGNLLQPTIVREWRSSDGEVLERNSPEKVRRVISEESAARVRRMLRKVVDTCTGQRVNSKYLSDIYFGGKTGTAEKYSSDLKGYDKSKQISSFIGLVPAENPSYVCMVFVDEPKGSTSGGATAGPIFRKIMEDIYFSPLISPAYYNLENIVPNEKCNLEFVGLSRIAAKKQADQSGCPISFVNGENEGSTVVATEYDFENGGRKLRLGSLRLQKMPDLKGLSLRDALEQIGELSGVVEYEGKGWVKRQIPEPNAPLKRNEKFKLVLSEKG